MLRPISFVSLVLMAAFCAASCSSAPDAPDVTPTIPVIHPTLVSTQFPTQDDVIATVIATAAPFGADASGKADATMAIQNAIDTVAKMGGGVVFLPAGRYKCSGSLILRNAVTLRGDWKAPDPAHNQYAVGGTVLMPTGGRGQADGTPFVTMAQGTGLRNLSVWYPEQKAGTVVPYPWTVVSDPTLTVDNSAHYTLRQVTFVNAYQGMRFGPTINALSTLRDVYGTFLKTGVLVDYCVDISRFENVRFSPQYWIGSGLGAKPDAAAVKRDLFRSATAFELLRDDWQYMFHVSVDGFKVGVHLAHSANGRTSAMIYGLTVTGGQIGMLATDPEVGIQMVNCTLDGQVAGLWTEPTFQTEMALNGCRLGGQAKYALRQQGWGTVRMQNCTLWKNGPAAIAMSSGYLTLLASQLPGTGVKVVLEPEVARALLVGSLPASQVVNQSHGDVQIDPQPLASVRPRPDTISLAPDPRPAKSLLFDVLDYGAHADGENAATASDNTAAFQSALDAAGKAGGGTVYVPAGTYRFHGSLSVPTGVEIRGCFDVPHHTVSWGSVLMPMGGRGEANGPAFLALAPHSGARGLQIWYPDQKVDDVTPYPWTVQSRGPGCWLLDFTSANSYQLADFGTYPSEGHLLRYVAGAPLWRGLWVSKGHGEVSECMFNAHYWMRRPSNAPPVENKPNSPLSFSPEKLIAFTFGSCPNELQVDNFVCNDNTGLKFVADDGKACSGTVINPGADGAAIGTSIEAVAPEGVQITNDSVANVGYAKTSVEVLPSCTGAIVFFNGLDWGSPNIPAMILQGQGQTTLQGWGIHQSEIRVGDGSYVMQGVGCLGSTPNQVMALSPVRHIEIDACTAREMPLTVDRQLSGTARSCGREVRASSGLALNDRFLANFEPGQTPPNATVAYGENFTSSACAIEPNTGVGNSHGLVLTAKPVAPGAHAFVYYDLFTVSLPIKTATVLRYQFRPDANFSLHSGVDLEFSDGTTLRASGIIDRCGRRAHPAEDKGMPGRWATVEIPLGASLAGKTISRILVAYDEAIPFDLSRAIIDNIEIGEPRPVTARK